MRSHPWGSTCRYKGGGREAGLQMGPARWEQYKNEGFCVRIVGAKVGVVLDEGDKESE